jgi:hypothetical protein
MRALRKAALARCRLLCWTRCCRPYLRQPAQSLPQVKLGCAALPCGYEDFAVNKLTEMVALIV